MHARWRGPAAHHHFLIHRGINRQGKMNLMLWLAAGGFAGWIGFRFIGANARRGLLTSMVIGIFGACLGGSVIAPMLGDPEPLLDVFDPVALIMALACAAACLTIGDMISRRFLV